MDSILSEIKQANEEERKLEKHETFKVIAQQLQAIAGNKNPELVAAIKKISSSQEGFNSAMKMIANAIKPIEYKSDNTEIVKAISELKSALQNIKSTEVNFGAIQEELSKISVLLEESKKAVWDFDITRGRNGFITSVKATRMK